MKQIILCKRTNWEILFSIAGIKCGKTELLCPHLPGASDWVMACSILNDRLGIALPVYFFGSSTLCSLGGIYCCAVSSSAE